tara:strand:- start:3833 stop:4975 length:1143 start_codon:yes stop_codon:yes gene_type:complete
MNKTLRIFITSLDYGGAERHLLQVLPRLKDLGWQPVIYTLQSRVAMKIDFEKAGIEVISPKKNQCIPKLLRHFFEVISSLISFYKILKKDQNCIAHFFLSQAYVLGMMAAIGAGHKGPKIMSRRSLNNYQKNIPFFSYIERKIHKKADLFLANSQAVKRDLIQEKIPEGKIKLIHNGIDLGRFNDNVDKNFRKSIGVNKDTFVMTIVANLISYKGHKDLLNALAKIKNKLSKKWILLCVGKDGGIQPELEVIIQELRLENHVKFLGLRSDIPQILFNSDLGVLCSHEEGMPNAVMEYMAAKLPVVATMAGGTTELVDNGKTGTLVPVKSPDILADALIEIMKHKDLILLGKAGREKIEKEFSINSCVDKYNKVYDKILRK